MGIDRKYLGSICEIKTMANNFAGTGYISQIDDHQIRISNNTSEMIILRYGAKIKVNVVNSKLGFQSLLGKVYLSTTSFISIADAIVVADTEKRAFFRVGVSMRGALRTKAQYESGIMESRPVKIENISLSGLMFSTKEEFEVGANVVMDFRLPTGFTTFHCKIMRTEYESVVDDDIIEKESIELSPEEIEFLQKNRIKRYGCEFQGATLRQGDMLCQFMLQSQKRVVKDID